MNEYTPTTDEIRGSATRLGAWTLEAFNRWYEAEKNKIKREALLDELESYKRGWKDEKARAEFYFQQLNEIDDLVWEAIQRQEQTVATDINGNKWPATVDAHAILEILTRTEEE